MNIIAHRGVSAHYLENTMPAFEQSLLDGVYGIELDLHQVEDEFIVFHDFHFNRLGQTNLHVADASLAQINKITLGQSHSIPLLHDVFELVKGQCMLNLEVKHITDAVLLINQIKPYISAYNGEVVITSFNHLLVAQLQIAAREAGIAHQLRFGGLIAHLPLSLSQYAVDLQVDITGIDAHLVTADYVTHAHINNLLVWCYTINYVADLQKLSSMGVDAVFCNDPALMKNSLR